VPALGAPPQMKPPTIRRRQAFHAPIAARLRSRVDSAQTSLHFARSSQDSLNQRPRSAIGRWYWRRSCFGARGMGYAPLFGDASSQHFGIGQYVRPIDPLFCFWCHEVAADRANVSAATAAHQLRRTRYRDWSHQ
jgi:hypothetical protein